MPVLALLLSVAALLAGCPGREDGPVDLAAYEQALAALRAQEGDGQLHEARIEGGEITFDLVREGPPSRVRWTGSALETTRERPEAGPYFDLAELDAAGARRLVGRAPVAVDAIVYAVHGDRLTVTVVGESRHFIAEADGSGFTELVTGAQSAGMTDAP